MFAHIIMVCQCEDILCVCMGMDLLSPNNGGKRDGFVEWRKSNN